MHCKYKYTECRSESSGACDLRKFITIIWGGGGGVVASKQVYVVIGWALEEVVCG